MKAVTKTELVSASMSAQQLIHESRNASPIAVSICGSYHRHLKKMHKLIKECKESGLKVLIPKYAVRKSSMNGFVYLKGEVGTPKQLQEKNFDMIAHHSICSGG